MITKIVKKIFGDPNQKKLKSYQGTIDKINELESTISVLSDEELRQKTPYFKQKLEEGLSLEDILPEVFAVVRETSKRVLNMRHFDVQLIGGIVLHEGRIAEMRTGEGKTLVATLPSYLNALVGKGVYIVTVNDYLAKRDKEWMGQIHEFLGLSVGLIQSGLEPEDRIKAYQADITYGTNNEYGFDYLRDNLSWDLNQVCQIRRHYAIIDEVDSILIDEARTPLIISGPIQDSTEKYVSIAKQVRFLKENEHFTLEEKHKNVIITEEGINKLEELLNVEDLYSVENMDQAHMATQCLRAIHLYKKDVDYVVRDGEVCIVDEFTGRILEGRRYSDGLHQSIEAIESVSIQEESQTLASITYQNYFRMFPKLAGMTGTAKTEESEFIKIYGLDVIVVPTNKVIQRFDNADIIFKSKEEKYRAIVKDVKNSYEKGQPVLVGSISIETSELISKYLTKEKIPHNVLNAKFHEKEAEIVANAGQPKMITIATNMAGRGTDIVLGEGVTDIGGLYVLGSERHESRRIDNQLRGRCGRQGDPGESRFYVCLEDDLMRMFGSDRIAKVMETLGLPEDTPIEHRMITRSIEKAQSKVEQYHFGVRKQILQFDDVMDRQRNTIYGLREQILAKRDLDHKIKEIIEHLVTAFYDSYFVEEPDVESEVYTEFEANVKRVFPLETISESFKDVKSGKDQKTKIVSNLVDRFYDHYLSRKKQLSQTEIFDEIVTKRALLIALDRKWMDHLYTMDNLREGIGLRAYGQRDPLIEYKKEGFDMFRELLVNIYSESMEFINRAVIVQEQDALGQQVQPVDGDQSVVGSGDSAERALSEINQKATSSQNNLVNNAIDTSKLQYSSSDTHEPSMQSSSKNASKSASVEQVQHTQKKIGRNDKVTIRKEGETQVLKWKKAQELVDYDGWELVE